MGIEKKRKMYKAVSRNPPPRPRKEAGGYRLLSGSGWSGGALGYLWVSFFFKILFIHERHREKGRHRQMEKQAPRREPDVGLNPRTLGWQPS